MIDTARPRGGDGDDGAPVRADRPTAAALRAPKRCGRCSADFLATLRSTTHRVTAQWHQDNVWIAEVEADYELSDWQHITALPRAFVLRDGPEGSVELHVYGAHERPIADLQAREPGMRIGGRWIPSL